MALSPTEIQERLRAAAAHGARGRHVDALALIEGLELHGADLAEACIVRSRAAALRGDHDAFQLATEQLAALADTPRLELILCLQRLRVVRHAGDRDAVLALQDQARLRAQELGDPELLAVVWTLIGDRAYADADLPAAQRAYERALGLGDALRRMSLRGAMAGCETEQGRHDDALAHLRAGLAEVEDAPLQRGMLLLRKGSVHLVRGEYPDAKLCNDQAVAMLEGIQALGWLRHAYAERGEVLRHTGQPRAAAAAYRRSLELGSADEIAEVTRLNLALVSVELGELDDAYRLIQVPVHERLMPYVRSIRASVYAHRGERALFVAAVKGLETLLDQGVSDLDLAAMLEDGARRAAAAGWSDHAARLAQGALGSWRKLGRDAQAERVVALLVELRGCRIPLGPFELRKPLGAGGMGEVWQGTHRAQGVAVAVKVLHGDAARTPAAHREFANEIRAVARLDHPHIVRVFDHGRLNEAVQVLSKGRLTQGSPFLVMELARGGSLARWCGVMGWPEIRRILLELLDALAHAHARGLIHRDLKPGNVLRNGGQGAPVRLTDFGLARALDDQEQARVVGTPAYMAPEQLVARTADFGPWTDLYALGCLAWALVCGAPPFTGPVKELVQAQRHKAPPPLDARCPVPEGLEGWLRVLLAKDPRARYRCAADAARALQALGPVGHGVPKPLQAAPLPWASETFFLSDLDPEPEPVPPPLVVEAPQGAAPIPPTWHRDQSTPQMPPQLRGVGLELFKLR
jgi:serine/threonine protein kinase/predicted negative regulator of RcsB-dependent stress response